MDNLNRISIIPREDLITLAGTRVTIHWRMTAEQFL